MEFRPPTGTIPDVPGSYQFLDADGRVLYVGKAKSLRHRLPNYWQDRAALPPRTAQMVSQAQRVEWMVVGTEVEALMLEHTLIQTHKPRYNIRLKDDKSYPWLSITVSDEWPRPAVVRGRKRKGVRYFGPYGHVGALRETLDLLLRSFPVRTCSDTKFTRHERLGRPCLLYDIERCSGPCIKAVEHDRYAEMVEDLMKFLSGETAPVVASLEASMHAAAHELDFERAAHLRDRLTAVRKAAESQQMVSDQPEDLDVIGIEEDDLEAAVQVFHVRRGRVVGRHGFIADKVEDVTAEEFVGRVLEQLYGAASTSTGEVPRRVLVPRLPDEPELLEQWLASVRGGPVTVAVPQRGAKRSLQELVTRNAAEDLTRHRLRRASDHNSRSKALTELQAALGLTQAPLRIECFDMSHLQGTDYVGSMVVFEDGMAKRSDYRRFKVKTVAGNDDYAAMEEVIGRRLRSLVEDRAESQVDGSPAGEPVDDKSASHGSEQGAPGDPEDRRDGRRRPRRFAYPPQLLLIDGGKGQLSVGQRVVAELGLEGQIELAALAKQFEEVYRPGHHEPVRIPRGSEALYLLQRVRDEAHRFAITFHRQQRGSRMTESVLDEVPGLGPVRRSRLIKEIGGVRALKAATREQFRELPWLPDTVADAVFDHLHRVGGGPGRTAAGNGAVTASRPPRRLDVAALAQGRGPLVPPRHGDVDTGHTNTNTNTNTNTTTNDSDSDHRSGHPDPDAGVEENVQP